MNGCLKIFTDRNDMNNGPITFSLSIFWTLIYCSTGAKELLVFNLLTLKYLLKYVLLLKPYNLKITFA